MRTRTRLGEVSYREIPTPISCRTTWEFEACLTDEIAATLRRGAEHEEMLLGQTLWIWS